MDQVLHIANSDPRIVYDSNWKTTPNSGDGQGGTYSLATVPAAQFFFLFRGTGIKFYGRLGGGGGSLQFRLDGRNMDITLNGTKSDDGPALLFANAKMDDGDHQLFVYIESLKQNGTVVVDYFEVENLSGRGFDLLWAGPNATNVPKEAVIVDNSSPDIVFANPSQWDSVDNVQFYKRSLWYTNTAGASLSYSFNGVAIWYYSAVDIPHGFFTVSIDGSTPQRLNGKSNVGQLAQQMLWSKTDLNPGNHTFTLTQDDVNGTFIDLDFLRILREEDASALSPGNSTATQVTATTPNKVPLVVGLVLGLFLLAALLFGAFHFRRRRRRIPLNLDEQVTPLHRIPSAAPVEQQSAWPRDSKRTPHSGLSPPQRTQSSSLQSTISPAISLATDDSTTSIGIAEMGLPPSYESHVMTRRVSTTE